jgi:hypothetical protein
MCGLRAWQVGYVVRSATPWLATGTKCISTAALLFHRPTPNPSTPTSQQQLTHHEDLLGLH